MSMDLPRGWCVVELADLITDGPTNGYSPQSASDATGTPTLKLTATTTGTLRLDAGATKRIHEHIPPESKYWLRPDDILIQRANTLEYVGTAAIYDGPPNTYIYPDLMMRIRTSDAVLPAFAWRYLNTSPAREFLRERATGTAGNMPKVNGATVRTIPVPVAPLAEQRRIVSTLDAMTAKSRRAKEALDAIPPLLDKFRQSVLAAAFRGDLTAEWRAKNPDVEPADKLLQRIRTERRRRWEEAELMKLRAKGKAPGNERWREKYDEPISADLSNGVTDIPDTWTWASVAQVSECLDSMRVPVNRDERSKRLGEYPYYGANGQVGTIDRYLFDEDLVLVTEDETFYGRTKPIAYKVSGKCWVNNHAHVLRPVSPLPIDYLWLCLMFYPVEPWLSGTTGRAKLTQGSLNSLPIPLPPLAEQQQIVSHLNGALHSVERVLCTTGDLTSSIREIDGAILAKAFRGELVPQDPADEPASVLLDRIRRERARAAEGAARPRRPR